MLKRSNYLCILLFIPSVLYGSDSIKTQKVKVLPVPAFGYSPETRTYIGAVALFTIDLYQDYITRNSNAKLELNYSWNKQLIIDSEWNYFFKEEKWFTKGKIGFSKYPDFYYGIGENTPDSNELVFNSNRLIVEIHGLKGLGNKLFMGLNFRYIDYRNIRYDNDDTYFPELKENRTIGFGYEIVKDTRNNLLTPTKGYYIYLNAGINFCDENYPEATLDIRYYKTWKEKFTLALRLLNDLNFANPPFYDLAMMGGDKNVRGYYYGRFRDNHLTTLQSEFRFPVVWRIGLAAFGGLSDLYSASNKSGLNKVNYNYGMGLRFLVDKSDKTSLRLDYAVGRGGNNGFYIAFGESF